MGVPHLHRTAPAIACTPVELGVMARILGAQTLIGLPDPFRGWTQSEIERTVSRAQEGLVERGYLFAQPDGQVIFDRIPALFVGACVYAQTVLIVARTTPDGQKQESYFHVNSELSVETQIDLKKVPGCQLTAWPDADALLTRAVDLLALGNHPEPARVLTGANIAQKALVNARTLLAVHGPKQASAALRAAGLTAEAAGSLANALASVVASSSFVFMKRGRPEWHVHGISILQSMQGLWLLQSHPRSGKVTVSSTTAKLIQQEIKDLMRQGLPQGGLPPCE